MHRFKVGQEVVAIKNHQQGDFKKGDEFIVDGLTCCPKCGRYRIQLIGFYRIVNTFHGDGGCNYVTENVRESFAEIAFVPKQSLSDAIEYRLSVSIPELTEIKIEQLQ